jgi:hypothetical protein
VFPHDSTHVGTDPFRRSARTLLAAAITNRPFLEGITFAAHVRHVETNYDELLARGVERRDARDLVREDVDRVLDAAARVDKGIVRQRF